MTQKSKPGSRAKHRSPYLPRACYPLLVALVACLSGTAVATATENGTSHWLSRTPPGVKPVVVELHKGVPVLHDSETARRYFSLLELKVSPSLLEASECRLIPSLWDDAALSPFLHVGKGCYGKYLLWKGSDEFERTDLRTKFMLTYGKALLDWLPALPQTVALIDDVSLGPFDTANSAFPLIASEEPHLVLALSDNFAARLSISKRFNWPQPFLPVVDAATARLLLSEVMSWTYPPPFGKPRQNDKRLMRRVTVLEILGLDAPNRRADVQLLSMGLFNFDLSKEYHRFPVQQLAEPLMTADTVPQFEFQSPAPLDRLHLYSRLVAATVGGVNEPIWSELRLLLATRDQEFYADANAGSEISTNDFRRPFFPRDQYALPEDQRPKLLKWAAAYAAGMPSDVEYTRDYTSNEFTPGRVYTFNGLPDHAPGQMIDPAIQAGFARERVLAIPGAQNALLITPRDAATYAMQIDAALLSPFAGKKLLRKTRLKIEEEKLVTHPEYGEMLLLSVKPISMIVEHDGKTIGSKSFD